MSDGFVISRPMAFEAGEPQAQTHESGAVRASRGNARDATVTVERATAARLADLDSDWRDLVARALEPNVFMHPGLLQALAGTFDAQRIVVLLAWQGECLAGIWTFARARALLPVSVLNAPAGPHAYLATPVIDRDAAPAVLHAMLDSLGALRLPQIVALNQMRMDGLTMVILRRVLAERATQPSVFVTRQRPLLQGGSDVKAYWDAALSASSRKKLRQHRRRLAERGVLEPCSYMTPDDIRAGFEDFLTLEAAGWKGRQGDALLCDARDAAFARAMVSTLAEHGDARMFALCLDGRPVSLQVVLRTGHAAFTWKTAYDEALQDFSPGMLLLEDYTAAFLSDPDIDMVDSCAFDAAGYMAVWRERETIGDLWIDARRGGSRGFGLCMKAQHALVALRSGAKNLYTRGKQSWKKRKS